MNRARDFSGTPTLITIFANCENVQKQLATDESVDVMNRVEELFEQMKEIYRELNNVKANAHEEIYAFRVNDLLERLLKTCREFKDVVKANADRLIHINGGADQLLEKSEKIMRKINNAFKRIDYKIYKGRSPSIHEKYKGKIEENVKSPKSVLEKPNPPQVGKFRENKTDENKIESVIEKSQEISPKINLSARKIRKIVKLRQKLMKKRKNWSLTIPAVAIGAVALILFLV